MAKDNFLKFFVVFFAVLLVVCCTTKADDELDDKNDKSQNTVNDDSRETDDSSGSDNPDKRSREEIMFGNQQNKPNGLVDNLIEIAENMDSNGYPNAKSSEDSSEKNDTQSEDDTKLEEALKDDDEAKDDKKRSQGDDNSQNIAMDKGGSDLGGSTWYSSAPVSADALQYILNSPSLQPISAVGQVGDLYDQDDLYRKRRQVMSHPLPLRKRSLRSPLGQMIQTRSRRLPRRSMRLKRQVDVDLLNLLGNLDYSNKGGRFYEEQIPENYGNFGYQEIPENNYRFPYTFMRDEEDIPRDNGDDDIDSVLLPQGVRYIDNPDLTLPYRSREDQSEAAVQDWMERAPQPNIFSVSRRSAPFFYPIDYRYVPGYKKRSIFGEANRMDNGIRVGRSEDSGKEKDFGKWGRVVQVPEAYASAEDVARLYALANLMAESEQPEIRVRRSM